MAKGSKRKREQEVAGRDALEDVSKDALARLEAYGMLDVARLAFSCLLIVTTITP